MNPIENAKSLTQTLQTKDTECIKTTIFVSLEMRFSLTPVPTL